MSTIRDVAKESGVSVATVSYVLNNGPRPVSEVTRKRVLEVVERLAYHPNGMARGLARRRADTIGILFPTVEPGILTNTYAFGILQGVLTAADEYEVNVTLYTDSIRKRASVPAYMDRRVDGLLLVAPFAESDLARKLTAIRLPLVGISVASEPGRLTNVDVDNVTGARIATDYLLGLGHKRVAHLTGDLTLVSGWERRDGYMMSMTKAQSSGAHHMVIECSYANQRRDQNKMAVRKLLTSPQRPTAIFAANDSIGIATIEAAREVGLKVPDDLSVVGFDDIPSAALVTPALTSVRQPIADIGKVAVRELLECIKDLDREFTSHRLNPQLIVRNSTCALT